jgi:hypothetical protein
MGLGEGSQSQTHRTPSCVPRWEIGVHNDRHLSWDWYIWIVVFLIFCRHVIRWNMIFLMLISKYILLYHGYEFYTQSNFIWNTKCKTSRNNCLIICLWQILVNNSFFDVSIFTTISLQFNELIITSINKKYSYTFVWRAWRYQRGNHNLYSKKNRQYNDQTKKYKRTNNDLQNIHMTRTIE